MISTENSFSSTQPWRLKVNTNFTVTSLIFMYENMNISQETSARALQDSLRDYSIEENQNFINLSTY